MIRLPALTALGAILLLTGGIPAAQAQQRARPPVPLAAPNTASTTPPQAILPSSPGPQELQTLAVDVDEGQVLRLGKPAGQVFVANPEIADIQAPERRTVLILGKKPGRTTVIALDDKGEEIAKYAIQVTPGLGGLRARLARDYPQSSVSVDGTPTSIIVAGTVDTPDQANGVVELVKAYAPDPTKVVNRLNVRSEVQVQLRVYVAEMSRQVFSETGINWQTVLKLGSGTLSLATGRDVIAVTPQQIQQYGNGTIIRNASDTVFGGLTGGGNKISAVLDLLGKEGLATVLAEPTLTAISGQTASFLAGGEFPVVTTTSTGGTNVTFREYGIRLNFTPTVLSHDRISLAVRPEFSQLTDVGAVQVGGIAIPALTTRRVDTAVELGSGDSFVIGGLLQNNRNNSNSRLPGLGDLPILGRLFQSQTFQNSESELVVMVTPYIVQPIKPKTAATPDRPYRADGEVERLILGRAIDPAQPRPRLHGRAGLTF